MTRRRDLVIGGACLAAAGAAWALTPRRRVSLLGRDRLAQIAPRDFDGWSSTDVSDLVAPAPQGSLMAKLYAETVERVYQNGADGGQVMMLLAHGDTQTNALQLHRPEVCYPAFGFEIISNQPVHLPLAAGVVLPARRLVADAPQRRETIVYWTRLGEFLPIDEAEQRVDRMKTALRGIVADGLLARFSILGEDADGAFAALESFVPKFVRATAPQGRPALIGAGRALAMSRGAVATARHGVA